MNFNMPQSRPISILLLSCLAACGDSSGGSAASDGTGATTMSSAPSTTGASTGASETDATPTTGTSTGPDAQTSGSTGTSTTTGSDPTDTTAAVSDGSTTTTTDSTTAGPGTSTTTGNVDCGNLLDAVVRDFSSDHPDFEKYSGAFDGIVKVDLGPDKKPVYAAAGPSPVTSGPEAFNQWYNDVPDVNQSFEIQLMLTEVMPGIFQYQNSSFFPIDDQGFGNQGNNHNFHFTTEIHTEFAYTGGEVFTFTGDDDLWMFINGKLAIDLGGVHGELSESIDLDASAAALGIVKGNNYTMDIFHAERHTTQSNFRIDTTIGCFVPVPG
jgi:fibro-slime domain-containing protein